jgi:putative ABC transport system substrate-binding protein
MTTLSVELGQKQLELLHELVPQTTRIGRLENETNPGSKTALNYLKAAARTLGMELELVSASSESDFDGVFATLHRLNVGALHISADPFITSRIKQLADLTLRHRLPAVATYRKFAAAGGLASYGANIAEAYRKVGAYAGRVLKGEKPADLPVQQSSKLDLVINLKTAKVLGLTVPPSLLVRADKVIE